MGMIKIETSGSFGTHSTTISAMEHGHASAVAKAIGWLAELAQRAIRQDHDLHEQGDKPEGPFGADAPPTW